MSGPDFIPAPVRARLKDLRLAGRRTAGGHGFGQHPSRSRGAGLEFAQYRAYEPGDELRQIDWKLYARSDRFFVREAERDSPLTAWVVVDCTASMAQGDAARPGWSRLEAARALAACVFELALRQGDRFGLAAVGGDGLRLVPPGAGPRQRDRCLLELQGLRAHGDWPAETALRPLWERIAAGHLVLVLSDDFDEGTVQLCERLAAARREVLNLQILTAEERDFPFRGGHRFRDAETGAETLSDGASAREGFLAAFAQARRALSARLAASGIRHTAHVLDEALDAPLRRLLAASPAERA
ncbi:DUF58 domain-containing protein [Arenimonas terrae]|jgi:uncharacterized protein (DUF58 family)|uniref:DUF58 domain-containing protein n=1 Tax=Arenimonas terrae TaxID=2546226 RepID=A0A5C4RWS3_9GAMM|nr:DUF58 domain-containing protein [Arenimonas terrae]TNJ35640.1 DUF58 domain-containing protein [Arenimonas terrae]